MTREQALREADVLLQALLKSGDEELFTAAQKHDGTIDTARLLSAMMRARQRLADHLMREASLANETMTAPAIPKTTTAG